MNEITTIYNLTAINQKLEAMNKQVNEEYNKMKEWLIVTCYSFTVFLLAAVVYMTKYL
jgi:hypothetical protein